MAETLSRLVEGRLDSQPYPTLCSPAIRYRPRVGTGVQNEGNVYLPLGVQLFAQAKSRSLIAINCGKEFSSHTDPTCAKSFV
jgi:hypothetical protein